MKRILSESEIIGWFKDNPKQYDFIKIDKIATTQRETVIELKCNECGNLFTETFDLLKSTTRETCKICSNKKNSKRWQDKKIKKENNSQKYYVYKFCNKENQIIYVGKSNDLTRRMNEHFSDYGHLPKECYNNVAKIDFIVLNSEIDMNIYELYYINLYKPYFNIKDKSENNMELKLPEKIWITYLDKENEENNTFKFQSDAIQNLKNKINTINKKVVAKKLTNNSNELAILDFSEWKCFLNDIIENINEIQDSILEFSSIHNECSSEK